MAHYTISQEAMQRGAVTVDDATHQIQSHIANLRSDVETMMAGWHGAAAHSFVMVHEAFEQQANKINNALRGMHEALVSTHRIYGTQETDQTHTLTGLAGRINA